MRIATLKNLYFQRVNSLSGTDMYSYDTDSYFNDASDDDDDDDEQYSGSDISSSVSDILKAVQYIDPDDLPALQWCHLPIVQTSMGHEVSADCLTIREQCYSCDEHIVTERLP